MSTSSIILNNTMTEIHSESINTTPNPTVESTLDDTTQVPINGEGVTLIEQGEPIHVTRSTNLNIYTGNARAESHLREPAWTLDKMLNRKTLVDTLQWPLTATPTTQIKNYNIITDLLTQDIMAINFTRFNHFRCKSIKCYFQLVASRFFQGRVIIAYFPCQRNPTQWDKPKLDFRNLYALQHVVLDPAQGSSAELEIDFAYLKGYLDIQANDALGRLYVIVQNQLQAVTGSPSFVEIKFFASVDQAEFKVPRAGGASYKSLLRRLLQAEEDEFEHVRAHSGIIEKFAEQFEPANLIGDLLTLLDKPTSSTNGTPVIRKSRNNLASIKSPEYIEKLTADPSAQQFCDQEHFNSPSLLSINQFTKHKLSFIETLNWKSTDEPGTILQTYRVGPLFEYDASLSALDDLNITPMAWMATLFENWRGSICFAFDVVNSSFHEGRLDITYHPNVDVAPPTIQAGMSQYANSVNTWYPKYLCM